MPTILLRNGTVLVHRASETHRGGSEVLCLWNHCVLIRNSFIADIAPKIDPPNQDTRVIDCTGKIISPGFVDTHHHLWQTQSKGSHADQLLLDYLVTGDSRSPLFQRNRPIHRDLHRQSIWCYVRPSRCFLGPNWWLFGSSRQRHYHSRRSLEHQQLTCP